MRKLPKRKPGAIGRVPPCETDGTERIASGGIWRLAEDAVSVWMTWMVYVWLRCWQSSEADDVFILDAVVSAVPTNSVSSDVPSDVARTMKCSPG